MRGSADITALLLSSWHAPARSCVREHVDVNQNLRAFERPNENRLYLLPLQSPESGADSRHGYVTNILALTELAHCAKAPVDRPELRTIATLRADVDDPPAVTSSKEIRGAHVEFLTSATLHVVVEHLMILQPYVPGDSGVHFADRVASVRENRRIRKQDVALSVLNHELVKSNMNRRCLGGTVAVSVPQTLLYTPASLRVKGGIYYASSRIRPGGPGAGPGCGEYLVRRPRPATGPVCGGGGEVAIETALGVGKVPLPVVTETGIQWNRAVKQPDREAERFEIRRADRTGVDRARRVPGVIMV